MGGGIHGTTLAATPSTGTPAAPSQYPPHPRRAPGRPQVRPMTAPGPRRATARTPTRPFETAPGRTPGAPPSARQPARQAQHIPGKRDAAHTRATHRATPTPRRHRERSSARRRCVIFSQAGSERLAHRIRRDLLAREAGTARRRQVEPGQSISQNESRGSWNGSGFVSSLGRTERICAATISGIVASIALPSIKAPRLAKLETEQRARRVLPKVHN